MPNYFPHDCNARNDEKLIRLRIRHKAAGYGVYFMLLEILRDKKDYMCLKDYNVLAFELREDAALIKSVIEDFGLFVFAQDGEYFYSESLMHRMERVDGVSAARRAAANRRWHPQEETQQQTPTSSSNNETIKTKRTDKRRAGNAATVVTTAASGKF